MLDFLDKKKDSSPAKEEEEIKVLPYNEWWIQVNKVLMVSTFLGLFLFFFLMLYTKFMPAIAIIEALKIRTPLMTILALAGGISLILMVLIKLTAMKMPPFDDWIFDIAQKHLSSEYLWYKGKDIYLDFDRNLNQKDVLDFVRELSNKSEHYTYYYGTMKMDEGVVKLTPVKKQEIPERATLDTEADTAWNIIPLGEAVNHELRAITPIGWWLNDNIKRKDMLKTLPSTSMLVAGGTGSGKSVLQNCVVGHISRHSDHFQAIGCDVKMVEFNNYVGVAGFKNIALTLEEVANSVQQARDIMYSRFEFMKDNGVNNIYDLKANVDYYILNGKKYQFDELFTCKVDNEIKILKIEEIFKMVEEEGKEVDIDESYGIL